ncbi:MAG: hypothetical protein ABIJ40_12880 [Bacteroidota bacterium]
MSKVIIGIHGLGNKPDKKTLTKWWLKSIREGLRNNGKFFVRPKFELIYWADVLNNNPLDEKIRDKNHPQHLEEKYVKGKKQIRSSAHPLRKRILDFVEEQLDKIFLNEDLSINYSFLSDMIIHKYFKDLEIYYTENCEDKDGIECFAKEIIRNRAAKIFKKYQNDEILLIAHSMGSIIAYDVLTFILPEFKVDTFVTIGSPLGMPIIIGKIAAEQKVKIHEKRKLRTPPGVMSNWYNFSDLEDKVAMIYDLNDNYDSNENGIRAEDIIVSNNYEINGKKNPHKAYGYLRTPEIAEVINNFLIESKKPVVKWLYNLSGKSISKLLNLKQNIFSSTKSFLKRI